MTPQCRPATRRARWLPLLLVPVLALSGGGCPGVSIELPGGGSVFVPGIGTVVVRVFNDTDFDVYPDIRFDDDSGFFAGLFPSETLATGTLAPGEILSFTIDCDKLGSLRADSPVQYLGFDLVAESDGSATFERGDDYDCGAIIEFLFIGTGSSFGVVVSINNVVVD